MKWIALAIVLAAIQPMAIWLKRNPRQVPKVWMAFGFLPFVLINLHLYVAVYSWAGWAGYVQGAEVSVLDALAVAFYLVLPSSRKSVPFLLSMVLYFVAVLLSVLQAEFPSAALLYAWQLARMFLIYAVVVRGISDPHAAPALLTGMAGAIFVQAGIAIWERFALGLLQASGSLGHQNTLGLMSHFVLLPFFALLLTRQRGWLSPSVFVAGVIIQVLTGSRATLGLAGLGYAIIFVGSAVRRWSSRKAAFLLVGAVVAAIAVPVALTSFAQRGEANLESSDEERVALESAAASMVADHPWGVGANHFVFIANLEGYYQRSGVSWNSYAAQVHNVYWLVAGETGYLGLITLVFLLLHPVLVAFLCSWRFRGDERADLILGLGTALLIVYIHSAFEWVLLTFEPQYLLAIDLGLVGGLAQQLGYWSRKPQLVRYPVVSRQLTNNRL